MIEMNSITAIIALSIMVMACIILIIYQIKLSKKQKNYIKTLNDHDKAVLLDYLKLNGFEKEKKE